MAITDLLNGIYKVANTIYAQVKLAKANKIQCQRLAERIAIILSAVKKLETIKETEAEAYRPGLDALSSCLSECQKLIEKFSSEKSWFKQVFKAGTHKETFKELNGKLEQCIAQLNLGLNAQQIMNQAQDKKDEAEDAEYIHKNLDDIKKLNETAIKEIKIVGEQQARQVELILARLGSLNLKMDFLAPNKQHPQKPETKPLIDPSLSIAYYELDLTHKLGEGSLGVVYRGRWQEQEVVVKHLSFDSESDESYQILINEAQVLSQCRHPQVVSLYGVCLEPGRLCLVKEYCALGTLAACITKPLMLTQKQQIALDIAKGLLYLHSRKILHLNLTSSHVLLTTNNQAKLNAFGLAKTKAQNLKSCKPSNQVAWQAPECFKKGEYSQASDVYSFAMILWTLVTGKEPFAEYQEKSSDLIKIILDGKRPIIPKETPQVFKELIEACWQSKPSSRPLLKDIIHRLESYKPEAQKNLNDNVPLIKKDGEQTPSHPQKPATPVPVIFSIKSPTAEENYQHGLKFEQQGKYSEAYLCYEAAVKQNHVKAYTNAGHCLLKGQGVSQDKAKAYQYLVQAANGKHLRGICNLALMLESGDGITRDLPKALQWYEEAAKLGDQNAICKCEAIRKLLSTKYQGNLHTAV